MPQALPVIGLDRLADPTDLPSHASAWLALQCDRIVGLAEALLVIYDPQDGTSLARVGWPRQAVAENDDLSRLAEQAHGERKPVVSPVARLGAGGQGELSARLGGYAMAIPVGAGPEPIAVVALKLQSTRLPIAPTPQALVEHVRWGAGWLESLVWARKATTAGADLGHALACLDLAVAAGEQPRLKGALMAIANELATRLKCDRVSVGLRRRSGSIRVHAISHSADFKREARVVEAIENAMEEAADQGLAAVHPPGPASERALAVAQRLLAETERTPDASVASVVLADGAGDVLGAVTLERRAGPAFDTATVNLLETMMAVIGPAVALHRRLNRPLTGRLIEGAGLLLAGIVGPRRPGLKLAVTGCLGLVVALVAAQVEHRITAKAVLEAEIQRAALAPFDGFIRSAPIRAGATVKAGELLATLDDRDLLLERAKWSAEHDKLVQRHREALAKRERSQVVILEAGIRQATAQMTLADEKIARARIEAPFDGIVVSGDLSQMLGSPIEKGKVLFEVAPLDKLRLIIHVDERDVRYVFAGQGGTIALAGMPWTALPISLARIAPVSVAEDGRNTFRVEAQLTASDPRARPGMEGIAKLDAGRRPALWVWTRSLLEWISLSSWKYLP